MPATRVHGALAPRAERRGTFPVALTARPFVQTQAIPRQGSDPLSNLTMGIFLTVAIGGLFAGDGVLFPPLFVALAVVAGMAAYHREPARYVSLVYGLVFLTPFVRRVIDLQNGYNPTNVVLLAPVLVTLISALTLVYRARELRGSMLFPFTFTLAAVGYAYSVGILKNGIVPASYSMLLWVAPISFAAHLNLNWRIFPELRDAFLTFLQWMLPLIAVYGIFQLVQPPAWDVFWVRSANVASIGPPIPFGFRVFGTLNMPGMYAVALVIGMLFLLGASRRGSFISLLLALVALMLTRTRSAWVALVVGLLIVQFMGPIRRMIRNWVLMLFMAALAVPLFSLDVFRDSISSRLASFASLSTDKSYKARKQLSSLAAQAIYAKAEGEGLGSTGGSTKLQQGDRLTSIDNGFLEIFLVLGWPGGALLCMGLAGNLLTLLRFRDAREDSFANSARACFWAMLSVLLVGDIFSGSTGVMYWGSYGFACGAHAYNHATGKGLRSRQLAREFLSSRPVPSPG